MDTMVYLGLWFKRIILVVLLSVFLELLLPSNSMQKYVRLVMGMVLITVIMLPIGQLLHMDMNSMEQQVLRIFQKESATDSSIQDILKKGEALKQADANQSFSSWKAQMENLLKDQLQKRFSITIENVHVQADLGQNQTSPIIQSLDVKVNADTPLRSTGNNLNTRNDADAALQIAPVQPVTQLQEDDGASQVQARGTVQKQTLSTRDQALQQQIVTFLQSQLQISGSLIHISFDDSTRR